jgi:hypothetical protein
MSNQIPGIPDGWELVAIRKPVRDVDHILGPDLQPVLCDHVQQNFNCVIIRKIEKPAKYRPFANAEEFKPHRDRWVRRVLDELVFRCTSYGGGALVVYGDLLPTFSEAFAEFVFDDDGTPFGVKIDE